ncbi:uncharacterized protein CIMG_08052 [Coccidioides immitis RS]|uniref:Autophagy protein n=1 Tax=Coccidioides immitis (strain RS) TaxID=246410 RepID=J3K4Q0_COCIM|nr:uncharacterized protein CIMG_08052 [Coccidioides immitis RS]EAS29306.3 hypothetical protein CIMG_08052 [Coccidioides immitis RS]
MGWFWGNSSGDDDPTKKLDPGLREYLEKETPSRYIPTTDVPSSEPPSRETPTSPDNATSESRTTVPSASLFPDGRYAHLWKTYQPMSELEGPEISPAEKVVDQFKKRKDVLNRAALENCAEEHIALTNCFKDGDAQQRMWARMTMCSKQNKEFSRCYTMQAKFLQALGYGSNFDWDRENEEKIQMHADKLYHQMLDYEARVEEAKAAGVEPPPLRSLFNPDAAPIPAESEGDNANEPAMVPGGLQIPAGMKPSKPLKDLTPHERELEVMALKQQVVQRDRYVKEVSPLVKADEEAKAKRRAKFTSWFGETIGRWLA